MAILKVGVMGGKKKKVLKPVNLIFDSSFSYMYGYWGISRRNCTIPYY